MIAALAAACALAGGIQHVVYVQLDGTSYPSDLQQMPALTAFVTQNGTLFTNDYAVIGGSNSTTALTGLYPDRRLRSSPWDVFTRAGCTVGNATSLSDASQLLASGTQVVYVELLPPHGTSPPGSYGEALAAENAGFASFLGGIDPHTTLLVATSDAGATYGAKPAPIRPPFVAATATRAEGRALHMAYAPKLAAFPAPGYVFGAPQAWTTGGIGLLERRTWVGFAGPGVAVRGIDFRTWTDHANLRPTLLALVGLRDGYVHDGHVLANALAAPTPRLVRRLGAIEDQLNAPFGAFAMATLRASTLHRSHAALAQLIAKRNALVRKIEPALERGRARAAWIAQGYSLLARASALRLGYSIP